MNTDKYIFQGFKELLRTRSFDQITVADIQRECGISRSTFYRHYSDKYELLSWYYRQYVNKLIEETEPGKYRGLLIRIFAYMKENQQYYKRLLNINGQNSFWSFLKKYSDDYYLNQIKKYREPTEVELKQIDFISVGDVHAVRQWVASGCQETPEELADFILSMIPAHFMPYLEF